MIQHNYNKRMLVLLFFIAKLAFSFADVFQNVRFKNLNNFSELPHNSVSSIEQDSEGYMWFATRSGLCRYDGYTLINHTNNPNDSNSISNNFVSRICHDEVNKCLWVTTDEGFCKYNYADKKFKRYEISNSSGNVTGTQFFRLKDGSLILITNNGLYLYDNKKDKFVLFFADNHDRNYEISSIAQDEFNTLWIATSKGLLSYNLQNKKPISKIPPLAEYEKIRKSRISFMQMGNENQLWFTIGLNEMYVFDLGQNVITKMNGFVNNVFRSLITDKAGNTWIGTEKGILVYDKNLTLLKHFKQEPTDLSKLDDNAIYCIYKDKFENIWVATYFGGVYYFIEGTQNFSVYPKGLSNKHLSGKAPRQIINGNNNDLWIATEDGGISNLNLSQKVISQYGLDIKPLMLKTLNIHSLLLDKSNKLWIGSFGQGLSRFDTKTKSLLNYNKDNQKLNAQYVFSLMEDKDGDVWAGTLTGLHLYNRKSDVFENIQWAGGLSSHFIYCLASDNDNSIWVGTRKRGLFRLNKSSKQYKKIIFSQPEISFITYIFVDSRQHLWVGTNYGVYELNTKGQLIHKRTTADGLPSNAVKTIVEDNEKNIWLSTEKGLCRLDISKKTVKKFSESDGIPVNQFNYASACKTPSGELFFGTINGLVSFQPSALNKIDNKFNVLFTSIRIAGEDYPISILNKNNSRFSQITLDYDQAKSFTVEFSGMNFRFGKDTYYATKLEGADNDWQYIGKQHQLNFSKLKHGKYLLHVKAGNDGLVWDEKSIGTLEITIKPPFWLSIWAYLIYIIFLAILFYYIYIFSKSRLNLMVNLKAEKSLRLDMEELNRQKINFFTYISHDLKTPLTLILSPLQRLYQSATNESEKSKLEVILRNANRMHYLVDELLTLSKIEMKQMRINVRKGDVFLFIAEVSKIFELYAKDRNIDFSMQLQSNQSFDVWFSPSKLERIIYNLLTNAFKYTRPNGMVLLTAKLTADDEFTYLELTVEDSGRGIPANHLKQIFDNYYQVEKTDHYKGFGIGLSLTKSLVTIHKGTIDVESSEGEGTKFIVKINVSENAYDAEQRLSEGISVEDIQKHNDRMQQTLALLPEYSKQSKESSDNRPTLLIVEDNEEMNNYLEDIFSSQYRVVKAYNGQEGYKSVFREIPDLIISDVMMPVMNGIEFLNKIKNNLSTSHIPVVLLTAKTDEADFTEGYLHGADAYITKPFNAQNLELLVSNLQKTKKSNIEHFKQEDELNVSQLASNPRDVKFIENLVKLIHDNLQDEDFGVAEIVSNMGVSRSLLHTKLKSLANASITEFVRSIKMKEARKHLMNGLNVSEASYSVGMSDPNYFTKCFKKQFNITPTEFINSLKK